MPRQLSLICAVCGIWWGLSGGVRAADEVPLVNVEGDQELLKLLHSAQVTNLSRYPRGEMTVQTHVVRGQAASEIDLQTDIKWDGDKTFWDYKLDLKQLRLGKTKLSPGDQIKMIAIPAGRYLLYSRSKLYQELRNSGHTIQSELYARPNQCWYSTSGNRDFADFFDSRAFSNERFKFQLKRNGDQVEFIRRDESVQHTLVMVFSLALDGNLVSFRLTPDKPEDGQSVFRNIEWARLPDQRLYVTQIHQETKHGRNSPAAKSYMRLKFDDPKGKDFKPDLAVFDKPTQILTMKFTKFNPDPQWAVDPFDPALWKLAPRVMVEKYEGASVQRFRHGSESTSNTENLNALAKELSSQGFAVPR